MQTETITYSGLKNNLRIFNDCVELIVSLEFGPLVLSCRHHQGENILVKYPIELEKSIEADALLRFGHCFGTSHSRRDSDKDEDAVYVCENESVGVSECQQEGVVLTSYKRDPLQLRKEIKIRLHPGSSSRITFQHTIFNEGSKDLLFAPWSETIFVPGGIAINPDTSQSDAFFGPRAKVGDIDNSIPEVELVYPYEIPNSYYEHLNTDNNKFIPASSANINGEDLKPLRDLFETFSQIKQSAKRHRRISLEAKSLQWMAYAAEKEKSLLIKDFSFSKGNGGYQTHIKHLPPILCPPQGCSNMTVTDMLYSEVPPGSSVELQEDWYLFPISATLPNEEEELKNWLTSFLQKANLLR